MTPADDNEQRQLLAVAKRNAESIAKARQQAEEELQHSKQELERTTHELARSLASLRATLDATADGIIVTDRERHVIAFNEHYLELWQPPPEVLEARDHRRLVEWKSHRFADPQRFIANVEQAFSSSANETYDVLELADGSVYERVSRVRRIDGVDAGRVWSFRDVTARVRAEAARRDEARMLELLNTTGATLAATLDLETLLQAVTDSATQASGAAFGAFFYNTTDAQGDAFLLHALSGAPREAFARFPAPRSTPLFALTFRGEGTVRSDDVLADPRYGQWGPHHGMPPGHLAVRSYLAVPVVSRSKEVIGGLFFGHPEPGVFTERAERLVEGIAAQAAIAIDNARLYEQATQLARERESLLDAERSARSATERANRMKDEFLTMLSHELRTPLTAILGWAAVLERKHDADSVVRAAAAITRSAKAQSQLIEDLLDLSRIASGKVRLEVQPMNLADVVEAALDVVRPAADAKQIRLHAALDREAGAVSGDAQRLEQVVWNLLSNAVKFTPSGGRIEVRLERGATQAQVTVADSGSGIEPEFLPYVFDRFAQADASSRPGRGGLGVGLAIVKHLVELHGGSVSAESAGAGRGATFRVSLPHMPLRALRDADEAAAAPGVEQALQLAGIKVLLVDDDADASELLRELLERYKAEVVIASSAEQALELIAERAPQVVVSDIGMPGVDGYEFIRRVRLLPAASGGKTPAIALTAFARPEDRIRAMLAGYQAHLAKPVDPHELAVMVSSLAGRVAPGGQLR